MKYTTGWRKSLHPGHKDDNQTNKCSTAIKYAAITATKSRTNTPASAMCLK